MKELISYITGCMLGRYAMDRDGIAYAQSLNDDFDKKLYTSFPADADGIIPVLDQSWFKDDIVNLFIEFVETAWPKHLLKENLQFIADAISERNDEQPEIVIRKYFTNSFFKDHVQLYKKRPIYWMFSSGKYKAFQCLVYLHRYNDGTLSKMRTEYVIPLQARINSRISQLESDIASEKSGALQKKLEKEKEYLLKQKIELQEFDEKLRHYADQRIKLDLDDGVKANYVKFGDLLAEVKLITGGSED